MLADKSREKLILQVLVVYAGTVTDTEKGTYAIMHLCVAGLFGVEKVSLVEVADRLCFSPVLPKSPGLSELPSE